MLPDSRLDLAAVTQPRGSKSACRGEAGELVHLDPGAPPSGGQDWWSSRPTKEDGSASETKQAKCFPKNREGKELLVRLVPAALSRGTSSSPLTRRVGVSCLSLTPPSGSLREPSSRRSWTGTSFAGSVLQLETGIESPRLYSQQTLS